MSGSFASFAKLLGGVGVISFAAVLIRYCTLPPLWIAFFRTLGTGLFLTPFLRGALRKEVAKPAFLAGIFLGLHFSLWIPSLFLTSIAASVMLVTTQPLFTLLFTPLLLHRRITFREGFSALLGMAGVAIIFWGDFGKTPQALFGDALALLGAVMASLYLVTGKRVRERVPLMAYLSLLNLQASFTILLILPFLSPFPKTWAWTDMAALLGLILGPSLLGHTALNWAMKYFPAYQVNLSILLEPTLATLWGYVFFQEAPHPTFYPGALLILTSLLLAYLPNQPRADVST